MKILDKLNLFFENIYVRIILVIIYTSSAYLLFREDAFLYEKYTNIIYLVLLFDIFIDLCNYIRRKNNLRKGENA